MGVWFSPLPLGEDWVRVPKDRGEFKNKAFLFLLSLKIKLVKESFLHYTSNITTKQELQNVKTP
jgi:hypothetical protein